MATSHSRTFRGLVGLIAAGLLLAACGDDDDSAETDETGGSTAVSTVADTTVETGAGGTAAEETTGGPTEDAPTTAPDETTGEPAGADPNVDRDASIVYASCCVPQVFDPHNLSGGGANGWFSLYDRLTYIGTPEDPLAPEVSPMVAESWEYSADGLTLTLSLRDDVTFNDGTPVTADAVKASLERAKASSTGASTALASVESVEATDDQTIVLTLSQPDGSIVANLAGPSGAVMNPAVFNDPAVDLDLAPPPGAGSGPFVLESHEPLTRSVLVRADDEYWDPEATYLAKIEIVAQPDATTRLNGLQSGQYQLAQLFSRNVPEGERLADTGEYQINVIDGRSNSMLFLDPTNPKLSDPKVRQAIASAVDRDGIAEGALAGTCTANGQVWSPGILGYDEDYVNPYPFDAEQARSLLSEAGADGLSIELLFPAGSTQETIATALQAQLADIGVTVTLTGIPPTDLLTEYVSGSGDGVLTAVAAQADADAIATNQLAVYTKSADVPEFTDLLAAGKASLDPDERATTYEEMNAYLIDAGLAIPFCNAKAAWVAPTNVINVDRMPWNWSAVPDVRYLGVVEE